MKKIINFWDFRKAFEDYDRLNQFENTLGKLFDYLEEVEESTGEEIELDVIGLCCDFTEWSAEDLAEEFATDIENIEHAIAYQFDNLANRKNDGSLYVVLSDADYDDLKLLADQMEEESDEEKRTAIAEALEDLAKNINAIAEDVEDDTQPIADMLMELDQYIDDFLAEYNQDVREFKS